MKKYFSGLLLTIMFTVTIFARDVIKIKINDAFFNGLTEAVELDGRYYVLAQRQRRIFVFNDKKFLFSFAQAGQGPGDLENPVTVTTDGENIFSVDLFSGRISVFSKKGIFLHSFKLKENPSSEMLFFICDLGVYNNRLIVVLSRGKDFFRLYDMQGNLEKVVSKDREDFKRLGHYNSLTIDAKNQKAYVFSRFSGDTYVVSLLSFRLIDHFKISTPLLDRFVKGLTDKDKEYKVQKGNSDLSETICLSPLILNNDELAAICYVREDKEGKIFPYVSVSSVSPGVPCTLSTFEFPTSSVRYIKGFSRYYFMMDYDGNIYLKKRIK